MGSKTTKVKTVLLFFFLLLFSVESVYADRIKILCMEGAKNALLFTDQKAAEEALFSLSGIGGRNFIKTVAKLVEQRRAYLTENYIRVFKIQKRGGVTQIKILEGEFTGQVGWVPNPFLK